MIGDTITPKSILLIILIIFVLIVCFTLIISDDWYSPTIGSLQPMNEGLVNIGHNNNELISIKNSDTTSDSIYSESNNSENKETCKIINKPEKCSSTTCGTDNLFPILDPRFNMRESAKQCLLLEDHLNNKQKRCVDCIKKHFLIIDGLLEEAISLEKDNDKRDYYRNLCIAWINIEKQYAQTPSDSQTMDNVSKLIRSFRKPLVEEYFDMVSEYET